jgi:hypothetical protein
MVMVKPKVTPSRAKTEDEEYFDGIARQMEDLRASFYQRAGKTPPPKPVPAPRDPQVVRLARGSGVASERPRSSPRPGARVIIPWTCARPDCGKSFNLTSNQRTARRRGRDVFYCCTACHLKHKGDDLRSRAYPVPCAPVREAVLAYLERTGESKGSFAWRLGMKRKKPNGQYYGDPSQLHRGLGMKGNVVVPDQHMRKATAIKIAEAIGVDPREWGV